MEISENLTIRPATEEDVGLIMKLILELADYEKMTDMVETTENSLMDSMFVKKIAKAVIAEYEGHPAGYALFFYNFSTFTGVPGLYMEDLYVRPPLRGRGIGKALLSYLAGTAAENGCARMEWVCLNWNKPSIRFYRGMGAKPLDEWTQYRLDRKTLVNFQKAD